MQFLYEVINFHKLFFPILRPFNFVLNWPQIVYVRALQYKG